ncbi:MAG: SLBB domain-containing protein, partial [Gemmatimonadota bacterium]
MKHRSRPAAVRRAVTLAMLLAAAALTAAAPATAQQPVPPPGTSASQIQQLINGQGLQSAVISRIRSSGLTPDQIRQRLASMGYDPSLLDVYMSQDSIAPPQPGTDVLNAARALGVPLPTEQPVAAESAQVAQGLRAVPSLMPDSSALERQLGLRVFGLKVFARSTTEFEPMAMGPVPPSYVLGPGDELVLILTGDVEKAYTLDITREGFIVIPQVGQVWVNGLTLAQLRDRLYGTLGKAYSGIKRGPNATTHFELSLGRLRANQLFLTGDVQRPGSYLASPIASVLNALYLAGGPTPDGSFRDVRIMRNGKVVRDVDLYDYLLHGNNLDDVLLQPGDVVFVPVHGPLVAIRGEVTRPAIYELKPDETLLDLIRFAGGLTTPASLRRARITRVLPPAERTQPGVDRVVLEVDLGAVMRGEQPAPALRPGDDVRIFAIRPEVRNVVTIEGAVWRECMTAAASLPPSDTLSTRGARRRDSLAAPIPADSMVTVPCTFRLTPGMRAWDLINAADGLKPDAYRASAQILRLNPEDSTLSVIPFSLEMSADSTPVANPVLQEYDAVRVFSRTHFQDDFDVAISGQVRTPLKTPYQEHMTLGDLILQAGGLTPDADLTVEIARQPMDPQARRAGHIRDLLHVHVDSSYIVSREGQRYYPGAAVGIPSAGRMPGDSTAAEFRLQPRDHVYVRRLPRLEPERIVQLWGQVNYPGLYALRSQDEHLSDLLNRAGGLKETAYPDGFRLYRQGQLVNVDLPAALRRPGSANDVVLLPGDSMDVPEYNPVVVVQGAVNSPAAVLYRKGAGLQYYIDNAGGYARDADRSGVHIRYANGSGAARRRIVFFRTSPQPGPGSVVTVPLVPPSDRTDWGATIAHVAQISGTLATL